MFESLLSPPNIKNKFIVVLEAGRQNILQHLLIWDFWFNKISDVRIFEPIKCNVSGIFLIHWHFAYLQDAYQTFCLPDKIPTDIETTIHFAYQTVQTQCQPDILPTDILHTLKNKTFENTEIFNKSHMNSTFPLNFKQN